MAISTTILDCCRSVAQSPEHRQPYGGGRWYRTQPEQPLTQRERAKPAHQLAKRLFSFPEEAELKYTVPCRLESLAASSWLNPQQLVWPHHMPVLARFVGHGGRKEPCTLPNRLKPTEERARTSWYEPPDTGSSPSAANRAGSGKRTRRSTYIASRGMC